MYTISVRPRVALYVTSLYMTASRGPRTRPNATRSLRFLFDVYRYMIYAAVGLAVIHTARAIVIIYLPSIERIYTYLTIL